MDQHQEGRTKHNCWTNTDERTDTRMMEGGSGGWRDGGGRLRTVRVQAFGGLYMTYLGGDERSSQQHRGGRGESREGGVWLNGILATTQLKVWSCFFSPLWACLHAHSIHSLHPNKGIIQSTLSVCSLIYWFQIHLWTNNTVHVAMEADRKRREPTVHGIGCLNG